MKYLFVLIFLAFIAGREVNSFTVDLADTAKMAILALAPFCIALIGWAVSKVKAIGVNQNCMLSKCTPVMFASYVFFFIFTDSSFLKIPSDNLGTAFLTIVYWNLYFGVCSTGLMLYLESFKLYKDFDKITDTKFSFNDTIITYFKFSSATAVSSIVRGMALFFIISGLVLHSTGAISTVATVATTVIVACVYFGMSRSFTTFSTVVPGVSIDPEKLKNYLKYTGPFGGAASAALFILLSAYACALMAYQDGSAGKYLAMATAACAAAVVVAVDCMSVRATASDIIDK